MIEQIKQALEAELKSLDTRTESRIGENHHDETGKLYFLGGKMAAYEQVEPWLRYLIGEVELMEQLQRKFEDMTESRDYFQREMNNHFELWGKAVGENLVLQKRVERLQKALEQQKLNMKVGYKYGYESETVFWERCIWEIDQALKEDKPNDHKQML